MKHFARVLTIGTLEDARREIERIGASPLWCDWMARKASLRVVRLENVGGQAANLLKQAMLARGGECAVAWQVAGFDPAPRPLLVLGTHRHYSDVLKMLALQPFGLPELGRELDMALRLYEAPPAPLVCHDRVLPLAARTLVMGIINTTPDSFSGDGLGADPDAAARQAERLAAAGADILDIGGQSTRPGSEGTSEAEELERVIPCLRRVLACTDLPVSIDTSRPAVAAAALQEGAHIINDITALGRPGMAELAAQTGAPVVLMHMRGTPQEMQSQACYDDVVTEVFGFLAGRLHAAVKAGVRRSQIVIDPGLGFGKLASHNLELMRRLRELRSLGAAVLVGPSRKATIGQVLGRPADQRQWGTAAVVAASVMNGASIVRVHDVEEMAQVARMTDAILHGWSDSGTD